METKKAMEAFYAQYDEDNRLRSKHGMVEFLTTMRYVQRYLQPGDKVLEIGAGTGRYSHELARMGYQVTAVELVEHNIEIFKKNTLPVEDVSIIQGDARCLGDIDGNSYDITLLLGPMYHLFTVEDQKHALEEAVRVTKPGGLLFVAYCGNEATLIQYCFQRGMIAQERYRQLIDPVTFKASSDPAELFQLYRREDIDGLIKDLPVKRLHYVGTDLATNYMRECVNEMSDEVYALYLKYHFSICERADLVGASHHILDVLRKDDKYADT